MSLKCIDAKQATCTLVQEFACRLEWNPERHYEAGTQVELRSHCLRALERSGGLIYASPVFVTVRGND